MENHLGKVCGIEPKLRNLTASTAHLSLDSTVAFFQRVLGHVESKEEKHETKPL